MTEMIEKELIKLSLKAYKKGEVPVAAVIVKDNHIIAKGYNKRTSSFNPLNHAEVIAIMKAAKKTKDWRLDNCDMYVNLEPCHMCKEIIKEARIRNVFYLINKDKKINYKTSFNKVKSKSSKQLINLLTSFFKELR